MIRTCRPRSTKRKGRRTKAEIEAVCGAMHDLLSEEHPSTARHMFYRMVSLGYVDKTEAEYKSTIIRLLGRMRREGDLPYHWLSDNTRWQLKPDSYGSLTVMLKASREAYRRALWADQPTYVEVWCEKDAIASILYDVTAEWDVPLMVARGYSSLSFLYSVAEDLKRIDKPSYLYYFGDHDPSGKDSRRCVEKTIRELAPDVELHFETVAVTKKQIVAWNLPTRPTKKTDSRAKHFRGRSVEVDAVPPHRLRELVHDCISQHVDSEDLEYLQAAEEAERNTLSLLIDNLEAAQ